MVFVLTLNNSVAHIDEVVDLRHVGGNDEDAVRSQAELDALVAHGVERLAAACDEAAVG
jgi:hypothetical protein